MLDVKRVLAAAPRKHEAEPMLPLATPFGENLETTCVLSEHPRPQFARSAYLTLHGAWEYAFEDKCQTPAIARADDAPTVFDGNILVPFSPEAPLSGVGKQLQPNQLLWYRLQFEVTPAPFCAKNLSQAAAPDENTDSATHTASGAGNATMPAIVQTRSGMLLLKAGHRCKLHFDGIDHECAVWLNGSPVAQHKGAYLPFTADITNALAWGTNELVVCVADPSDTGAQLRGKQRLDRGDIWYTAQSGMWQPVWLEAVPATHVDDLRISADMHGNLAVEVTTGKPAPAMKVTVFARNPYPQESVSGPPSHEPLPSGAVTAIGETGIVRVAGSTSKDDPRKQVARLCVEDARLWTPEDPNLYAIEIRCGDDKVQTYCAFRTVEVKPDDQGVPRFHLNGKPYFLRGVLDQGYWPDGLLTAPSDEALAFDIASMKELGFNMLRKHIKAECERWYWHCDRLGMLVWQDMPSGGGAYDVWHTSHRPTLFRSSWTRQPDNTPQGRARLSGDDPAMQTEWTTTCRNVVQRLGNHPCIATWALFNEGWGQFDARSATDMVRSLDPSRPIDATSGWYDQGCGDYWSVHNYFRPLEVWPDQHASIPRAFVISEFGGLNWHNPAHSALGRSYGYASFATIDEWCAAVGDVLARADALESKGLAGFVYTQLSDVEEETNGLLTYDRKVSKLQQE